MKSGSVRIMAAATRAFVVASFLAGASVVARGAPAPVTDSAHVAAGPCRLVALPGAERSLTSLAVQAMVIVPRLETRLGVRARSPYAIVLIPPNAGAAAEEISRGVPEWA